MGNTIRRQPVNFNIPNSPNYKFLNITDFKGLNITDNPFNGEPETASDLLNVYVDEQNTLTTRPRLQKRYCVTGVDVVLRAFQLTKKDVFQHKTNGVVGLKFVDRDTQETTDVDLTTNNIVMSQDVCFVFEKDDRIYFLNNNNYCVIKADNIAYLVDNDTDTYTPIAYTGYEEDGKIVKKQKEAINILNNKVRTEYFWDVTKDMSSVLKHSKVTENNYFFEYDRVNSDVFDSEWYAYSQDNSYQFVSGNRVLMCRSNSRTTNDVSLTIQSKTFNSNDSAFVTVNKTTSRYYVGPGMQLSIGGSSCFVRSANGDNLVLWTPQKTTLADAAAGDTVTATILGNSYYWWVFDIDDKTLKNQTGPGIVYTSFKPTFTSDGLSAWSVSYDNRLAQLTKYDGGVVSELVLDTDVTKIYSYEMIGSSVCFIVAKNDKTFFITYTTPADTSTTYIKQHELELTNLFDGNTIQQCTLVSGAFSDEVAIYWYYDGYTTNNKIGKIINLQSQPEVVTIVCEGADINNLTDVVFDDTLERFTLYVDYPTKEILTTYEIEDANAHKTSSYAGLRLHTLCYTDDSNLLAITYEKKILHIVPKTNANYVVGELKQPSDFVAWHGNHMSMLYNGEIMFCPYVSSKPSFGSSSDTSDFIAIFGIARSEFPELIIEESVSNNKKPSMTGMFRFQNNFWFYGGDNVIYWTNNNNPTYIGKNNYDEVGDTNDAVIDAVVVSYDVATIFKKDNMYVISPVDSETTQRLYTVVNAKSTIGVDAPHTALVSPLKELPLFVNKKGIYGLQQLQNVQSSQNVSVLISEAINPKWLALQTLNGLWSINRLYWTFFVLPTENNTQIFVFDDRNASWFYWELQIAAISGWVDDNVLWVVDADGCVYSLETSDIINEFNPDVTEYYDDGKKLIPWFWTSQVLHLGTMNYSKKLVDTTFIVADTEMSDEYGLNYAYTAYRKMLSETQPTTITSKLNYVQSTTKRTMIPRFNFIQLKLSNVDDDYNNNKLRLIGLGLKYVLLEGLLR